MLQFKSTVKDIFFRRAAEFLNVNIPLNSKVIMCGDMNIKLDIKPGISQCNKKEIILLNTLTAKYNLKDIFRARAIPISIPIIIYRVAFIIFLWTQH